MTWKKWFGFGEEEESLQETKIEKRPDPPDDGYAYYWSGSESEWRRSSVQIFELVFKGNLPYVASHDYYVDKNGIDLKEKIDSEIEPEHILVTKLISWQFISKEMVKNLKYLAAKTEGYTVCVEIAQTVYPTKSGYYRGNTPYLYLTRYKFEKLVKCLHGLYSSSSN